MSNVENLLKESLRIAANIDVLNGLAIMIFLFSLVKLVATLIHYLEVVRLLSK